jgi:glyoxylase I family protein
LTARFSHFGICVSDLERSVRFYSEAFGFEPTMRHDIGDEFGTLMEVPGVRLTSQFMERDGHTLELLSYASPGVTGDGGRRAMNALGLTHLSFRVGDIDEAAARVEALGGAVHSGTRTTFSPDLDFVYCTDPDGTRIELMRLPG